MQKGYKKYFQNLKDIGEETEIIIIHEFEGKTETFSFLHENADGLTGLKSYLKSKDLYDPQVLPKLANFPESRFSREYSEFKKFSKTLPLRPSSFKKQPPVLDKDPWVSKLLSSQESENLKNKAKSSSIPLPVLLLDQVNKLISPFLENSDNIIWNVPVTMIGDKLLQEDSGNKFSFVDLYPSGKNLKELSEHYKGRFSHENLLAGKMAMKLYSLIPNFMLKKDLESLMAKTSRTGLFTNIGIWDKEKTLLPHRFNLIAPVFKHVPFSFLMMSISGNISLSMKVHREIGIDKDKLDEILKSVLLALK